MDWIGESYYIFLSLSLKKKKVSLFQTWFFAVPGFILNSDSPTECEEEEIIFLASLNLVSL